MLATAREVRFQALAVDGARRMGATHTHSRMYKSHRALTRTVPPPRSTSVPAPTWGPGPRNSSEFARQGDQLGNCFALLLWERPTDRAGVSAPFAVAHTPWGSWSGPVLGSVPPWWWLCFPFDLSLGSCVLRAFSLRVGPGQRAWAKSVQGRFLPHPVSGPCRGFGWSAWCCPL